MIEGVLRHATTMSVKQQYVGSHGQSEVAFAFCRRLGFDLLPFLTNIHSHRFYRPVPSTTYGSLAPVLTRAIDWDLIAKQYDPIVQYATALLLGTAQTQDILRRFTCSHIQHPVYLALAELGKNSANNFTFFGKSGEMAYNRPADQLTS